MNDKRALRIVLVGLGAALTAILWLATLRFNLQGGFKSQLTKTLPSASASSTNAIEDEIQLLKLRYAASRQQMNKLLQQSHG